MSYGSHLEAGIWEQGCAQWLHEGMLAGYKPYFVTIMFQALRGTSGGIVAQMHRAIRKGFYCRFCTQFVHHPRAASEQNRMPRLMLFPDRPVFKHERDSLSDVALNANGLHFQGAMLIPPKSRFWGSVIDHIMADQPYARHGIQRIHVKEIDRTIDRLADYLVKTLKWGRADPDDVLILPLTSTELYRKPQELTAKERAIRDIKSRTNVSDEMAERMYEAGLKRAS